MNNKKHKAAAGVYGVIAVVTVAVALIVAAILVAGEFRDQKETADFEVLVDRTMLEIEGDPSRASQLLLGLRERYQDPIRDGGTKYALYRISELQVPGAEWDVVRERLYSKDRGWRFWSSLDRVHVQRLDSSLVSVLDWIEEHRHDAEGAEQAWLRLKERLEPCLDDAGSSVWFREREQRG